ncbi:DUF2946 domain-containing protein [Meiothermus sp. QL-1]|nr:DUF2946 domain-containing protein [Meiothermus sp. QL-1]
MGLVVLALLAFSLYGLRGAVLLSAASSAQLCTAAHTSKAKAQPHLEHCPLCLLQIFWPDLDPLQGLYHPLRSAPVFAPGGVLEREVFGQGLGARGPPIERAYAQGRSLRS